MQTLLKISALIIGAVVAAWALYYPVNSGLTRVILVSAFAAFLLSGFSLIWKNRYFRYVCLIGLLLLAAFLMLPVRPHAQDRLHARYINALSRYENSPYFWGGENRNGIDCSGLPRKAMRDALVAEGLASLNGGLVREAIAQWWFDASARALAEGYRNYMFPVGIEGTIRSLDYAGLRPGDVAITKSGIHCLVYYGDDLWIQADPNDGSVGFYDGRLSGSAWMDAPVMVHRWSK